MAPKMMLFLLGERVEIKGNEKEGAHTTTKLAVIALFFPCFNLCSPSFAFKRASAAHQPISTDEHAKFLLDIFSLFPKTSFRFENLCIVPTS